MKWCTLILTIFFISLIASNAYSAERVALVIGNGDYRSVPLKNPVNDAVDVTRTLQDLGFSVIIRTDADKQGMISAMDHFARKLKRSDIGLFYYAGHAIQVNGSNYLIPINTSISSSSDVQFEAVNAGRVLGKMEEADNNVNIVVLDACRNNPFRGKFRSQEKGLAKMDVPAGSVIAYATAPGSVAADGDGRNGVYTKHLLTTLPRKDLTVQELFNETGLAVMQETGGKQVPWYNSSPMRQVYLASDNLGFEVASDAVTGIDNLSSINPKIDTSSPSPQYAFNPEEELWRVVKDSNDPAHFQLYLNEYPDGRFSKAAKLNINKIRKEQSRSTLTVQTEPAMARVRILNIKEKYHPGIELDPGSYKLEVSSEGYKRLVQIIDLPPSEQYVHSVKLESLKPKPGDVYIDQPTGMEFVFLSGGCYRMGDKSGLGFADEKPIHEVCVDDFYIGKYEVTQGQYEKMVGNNPSRFKKGSSYPVENVSWDDAQAFINKLNRNSGQSYRLPTEAEWEYAARSGGKNEKYAGGNIWGQIGLYAWYMSNSGSSTHPVGTRQANGSGIHDMSGNVWEWVQDWYGRHYYKSSPRSNPTGPSSGVYRVNRGGGWESDLWNQRSSLRYWGEPADHKSNRGFRLALPVRQ